jgi:hypothetical protein
MCELDVTFQADSNRIIDTIKISFSPMEAAALARRLILNVNMMKEVDILYETSDKECIIIQTVKEEGE